MKSFIGALVLTVVIIVSSLLYVNKMDKLSSEMIEINEKTYELLVSGDYEGAAESSYKLMNYLEDSRVLLTATGDHEEIKKIELMCCELTELIRNRMDGDSRAKCAALDMLLEHMPKNYKIKAENIL